MNLPLEVAETVACCLLVAGGAELAPPVQQYTHEVTGQHFGEACPEPAEREGEARPDRSATEDRDLPEEDEEEGPP